jgi:type II secretory pathway component PulF
MPFYKYAAEDPRGMTLKGTILADNEADALDRIRQQGLVVRTLQGRMIAGSPAPTASRPMPGSGTVRPPAGPTQPVVNPVRSKPVPSAPDTQIRTGRASDKDLFEFFCQVSRYLNAGVTPQVGFQDLSQRLSRSPLSAVAADLSAGVGEGKMTAQVMAKYPDLFSPDMVSTVEAGEVGGFASEAFELLSQQMQDNQKVARPFRIAGWLMAEILALVPLVLAIFGGALASIRQQDEAGGSLPRVGTLITAIGGALIQMLPAVLVIGVVAFFAARRLRSTEARGFRHAFVAKAPMLAKRVRSEAMHRFSVVLFQLSKAGLPPYRVYQLAAASIPNLAIRQKMMASGETARENEPLSLLVERTGMVDNDYRAILRNGETVGDVPGALVQIGKTLQTEYESQTSAIGPRVVYLHAFGAGIFVLCLVGLAYTNFLSSLIKVITGD